MGEQHNIISPSDISKITLGKKCKMTNEKYWKNNGNSKNPIYDFMLQEFSEAGKLKSENEKILKK